MKKMAFRPALTVITMSLVSLLLSSCAASGPVDQAQESPSPTTQSPSSTPETSEPTPEPTASTPQKTATPKPPKLDNPPEPSTPAAVGNYITYDQYLGSLEQYEDSNVVLFFNASWCSTCRTARGNFEASLATIPADLTLVVVNFENSAELKRKHGVTLQHTFIHTNTAGDLLHKWSGSVTFSEIVNQIT